MNRSKERKKNRLRGHDYSQNGYYFITTCVYGMNCVFGEVVDSEMILNKLGKIVEKQILWLEHRFECVKVLDYVVMPNHVHMVLYLDNSNVGTGLVPVHDRTTTRVVPTISGIVGAFKSIVSVKHIRLVRYGELPYFENKLWQRSFHDHIIKNDKEYERISEYIFNNPLNWKNDDYFNS